MTPDVFKLKPAGRPPLPETSENLYGVTPPVTGIVALYGAPFDPHGICAEVGVVLHTEFVIVKVSGNSTVIVAVLVAVVFATAVAVRVTLKDAAKPEGAVYVTLVAVEFVKPPQPFVTQFVPVSVHVTPWLKRSLPKFAEKLTLCP